MSWATRQAQLKLETNGAQTLRATDIEVNQELLTITVTYIGNPNRSNKELSICPLPS